MKFLHLANFNSTNIGNGALIYGTERVLREDLGAKTEFAAEPWDDYTFGLKKFDGRFVELVNRHDALLVNGAVTFNGREYLKNAGMRLDLPLELWPEIKKPIIFYGVSYRVWPGQPYHNLDKLKPVMNYLLKSPRVFFGARNDGTKEWLENLLGYQSDKIMEIPDPAMFVPVEDSRHPELAEGKKNIIVAFNNEDEAQRFAGRAEEKGRFLRGLAEALARLSRETDLNIILAPHYLDDYKMIGEFVPLLPPRIAHQLVVSSGILKSAHACHFYGRYAKADLVLGMRVHSISPAVGLGTPVVALSSQSRIDEFLRNAGLSEIAVNVFDAEAGEKIYQLASSFLKNPGEIRNKLGVAAGAMRGEIRNFNLRVGELIKK